MSERAPRLFGMSADMSVFVGFIAAPTIGGGLGLPLFLLVGTLIAGGAPYLPDNFFYAGFSFGFVAGFLFGIPAAFVVGLPVHTVMFGRGLVHVWHYAFFGCLIGALNSLLIGLAAGTGLATWQPASLFAVCGAIGGVVFWLIRRPDRDAVSASPKP